MATKTKAYTVSTKLQAVVVAAQTSNKAAANYLSVPPCKIHGRLVTLTTPGNFCLVQIVRLLQTTLSTALYNKKASQVTTAEIQVFIFTACGLDRDSSYQT